MSAPTIDEEVDFRIEELFFSTTDPRGVIRQGNRVFVRVSGYSAEELFGSAHSIIRHPDMPRVVFQLLWETIQQGKTIAAYVKNRAKCGRYYWVMAVVMPCEQGYLSIRLKPTSPLLPIVRQLYAQLLQIERSIEQEPKQRAAAMEASAAELTNQLKQLGFANYDAFMYHALSTELSSRSAILRKKQVQSRPYRSTGDAAPTSLLSIRNHCLTLDQLTCGVFDRLDEFKQMNLELAQKSQTILSTADSIRALSLNASIAASKLGAAAGTLRVIAESLGDTSDDSESIIAELSRQMGTTVDVLNRLIFDVAATKLQSEVSLQFLNEIIESPSAEMHPEIQQNLRILISQVSARIVNVFEHVQGTEVFMRDLLSQLQRLERNICTLRFVQFAGKKEAVNFREGVEFGVVFDEVRTLVENTTETCNALLNSLQNELSQLRTLKSQRARFQESLDAVEGGILAGCLEIASAY